MLHASLLPSTPSPQLPGSGGRGVEQTEMLEKGSDCVNTVAWSFGKREQVGKAVTGTVCPRLGPKKQFTSQRPELLGRWLARCLLQWKHKLRRLFRLRRQRGLQRADVERGDRTGAQEVPGAQVVGGCCMRWCCRLRLLSPSGARLSLRRTS